jgi:hypothetical protein
MLTDDERLRARAWLWAEFGQAPGETDDELAERCRRALCLPEAARAEVAILLAGIPAADALVDLLVEAMRDDDIAIGAAWVLRFGPIATDEQFAAIVQAARLGQARRAEHARD